MRLFVAALASPKVAAAVATLDRPAVPGLRWTTEDQWHVTLRFLGEVPEEQVGALAAALPDGPGPEVVLGPTTTRLGRSLLVVPVAGLDEVAAAVLAATAAVVPASEGLPFVGHLTLARARRGGDVPDSLVGQPLAVTCRLRRLSLVRSTLGPGGARYEEVAGRDLGEGA